MSTDDFICAFAFDEDGVAQQVHGDTAVEKLRDAQLAWVHLDGTLPESRSWLKREIAYLDSIILDALLADETRPRAEVHGNGLLLNLRGINLNENAEPEDMVSIRIWVDPERIVTVQRRQLKAVDELVERMQQGYGPKSAADFLLTLSSRLIDRIESAVGGLSDTTDGIEAEVSLDDASFDRSLLGDRRRAAILLRRYIAPQREAIQSLKSADLPWFSVKHIRLLAEQSDRLTRIVEELDAIRERLQIIKDEIAAIIAARMNQNTYVLSIAAAVFLPLGFLTGLLGINVGGIPGTESGDAFWIVAGGLGLFAIVQVTVFRFLRWI